MYKYRFWSISLGKAEQFMQSPLSICFVGCDEQSPWWEKHPPVQNLPLTVPLQTVGLSSLFSSSAVLVWRDDTAWEWGCCWEGWQRQNGCRQDSRNPVIRCAAISALLCSSFRITLVMLYFHCTKFYLYKLHFTTVEGVSQCSWLLLWNFSE